jgi:hypothetical protein
MMATVIAEKPTESPLSKAATTFALTCFLIVGAAGAAYLGHGSEPAAGAAMATPSVPERIISNWQGKGDRLAVAAIAAPAANEPVQTGAVVSEPLRQAYAATPVPGIEGLKVTDSATLRVPPPRPRTATKPVQKTYALLSDAQIAGIKERLKLSPSQESYWPAVENALRAVARKIHATRQADPNGAPIIDPEAEEVQQLKAAAMPLLFQLREDQKREVRSLARLIGLEKVAAAI